MRQVVGYLRVSTLDQAEHGYGLDAQREAIRAEAARRRWEVTWITDGGKSGKDIDRPGMTAALDMLARGDVEGVVVAKLDRLTRSLSDFAGLMERARRESWSLVALDLGIDLSTPTGELLANVMASVAQWERRMIGQRTKEGLAAARERGQRLGAPSLVDAEVVQRIRALRATGASYASIAGSLNNDHVPCASGGKQWYPATVRKIALRDD